MQVPRPLHDSSLKLRSQLGRVQKHVWILPHVDLGTGEANSCPGASGSAALPLLPVQRHLSLNTLHGSLCIYLRFKSDLHLVLCPLNQTQQCRFRTASILFVCTVPHVLNKCYPFLCIKLICTRLYCFLSNETVDFFHVDGRALEQLVD